jgi:CubicO group peptidase (beta-lactamase class C family)
MVKTLDAAEMIEAEPEDVGLSSARLKNLSRMAQGYVDERRIPGAITMVARHGKTVHFEIFGNMDDEAAKPMQVDTIFRLASMTKPIASVALMTLYEEGCFQLDDPVSRFIPELKSVRVAESGGSGTAEEPRLREPAREITIADLLRHTSGYGGPSPTGGGPLAHLAKGTLRDLIETLSQQPLLCDPGAQWNYGISTDIVGYLCEAISGRRFDEFLEERIFSPLRMVDTAFQFGSRRLIGWRLVTGREAPEKSSICWLTHRRQVPNCYRRLTYQAPVGCSPRRLITCASVRCSPAAVSSTASAS